MKEALEANDWEVVGLDDDFDLDALEEDDEGMCIWLLPTFQKI